MPDSEAVGAMTPLREFFLLSSVITCFVDLLEGAGVATGAGGVGAVVCAGVFGGAAVVATAGAIVGATCFTFAEAAAGAGADFGLAGAATGLLAGVFFAAVFATGFGAAFAAGLATGFAAGFAATFAAFAAGFAAFAVLATGFVDFFAGAAFAGTFFEAVLDVFFTALAPAATLPLATTFFAVLRVLFAISVHRCG